MGDKRRRTCLTCGRRDEECGGISWSGNCIDCGLERLNQSVYEQIERRGPMYRRWRSRLLESLERLELDADAGSSHTPR